MLWLFTSSHNTRGKGHKWIKLVPDSKDGKEYTSTRCTVKLWHSFLSRLWNEKHGVFKKWLNKLIDKTSSKIHLVIKKPHIYTPRPSSLFCKLVKHCMSEASRLLHMNTAIQYTCYISQSCPPVSNTNCTFELIGCRLNYVLKSTSYT